MRTRRRLAWACASLLALAAAGCGGAPSLGPDKQVFKAVDALYTAVSLREPKLVAQCAAELTSLRDDQKLPAAAASALDAIIARAEAGKWEDAQNRLSDFMEGQRR